MIEADATEHVRGSSVLPLIAPAFQGEFFDGLERVLRGETVTQSFEIIGLSGTRRWVEQRAVLLPAADAGRPAQILAVTRDMTARRRAETDLRRSEDRFRKTFQASPSAQVIVRATDGIILEVNEAMSTLTGRPRSELIGQAAFDLVAPSDTVQTKTVWAKGREQTLRAEEFSFTRRDGRVVHVRLNSERIDSDGVPSVLAILHDVTARRAAEQAQQDSELRFRELAENIEEVFWLSAVDKQQILYISPGYEKIWGRDCEAIYRNAQDWLLAIHEEDRPGVAAALSKQPLGTYDEEYRILRPDGEIRWIRDRAFPIRNEDGSVDRIAGVAQDITQRRQLEDQLRQTQKMESIGLLAGGVAHDFNNLLTIISSNAQLLNRLVPDLPEMNDVLDEIHHTVRRATSLTRQLLTFSRQVVTEPVIVELNEVVRDTDKMLCRLLGEDIDVTTKLDPYAGRIRVDPNQLVQVIVNLAVNARDAMPGGGCLVLETRAVEYDETAPHDRISLPSGKYCVLALTDTGVGMTPEIQSRIFEPFFTTKGVGRGTGLGLAVVHGIVAQSGGLIDVASTPDLGTTFRIFLPMVAASALPRAKPLRAGRDGDGQRILIVEDEEKVRSVVSRLLRRRNFNVLEAPDGQAALDLLFTPGVEVDLVMTDVVMPRMDGPQFVARLRERFPTMPVLYTSGHTDDALLLRGIQQAEVPFIAKPYMMDDLVRLVVETLTRPVAAGLQSQAG
jgi:PAS domain S-box-containing protein